MNAAESFFAPAGRASADTLARQFRYFAQPWFFGQLLDSVPTMVLILNEERQVVFANRVALEAAGVSELSGILGLRPGELLRCKKFVENQGGCGTTRFCKYCGLAKATVAAQAGRSASEECRVLASRGDREIALEFRVSASPITIDNERFSFFAITDIADEKRRLFLEQIFLHDILNTASALHGYAELLGTEGAEDYVHTYADRLNALSERIIEQIEAHQQLVAAERDDLLPKLAPINSLRMIEEISQIFERHRLLDRRHLAIAPDSAEVEFQSDPIMLRRVLCNMIKNAIEASAPGETVALGCREEDDLLSFWVHNAAFIPEEVRLQLFQRSFSTKGRGRGLGTYSMKLLTERYLGGSVSFKSTETEGTTFNAAYPKIFPSSLLRPRVETIRH